MNSVPWLTIAGAIPLVGAVLITAIPGLPANGAEADRVARDLLSKRLALGFSVLTLIWFIIMAAQFKPGGPTYQFTQTVSWIPQFGVHYAVGADGIALLAGLDMEGVCASSGSACSAGSLEPSHVVVAIGKKELANSLVRFSLGRDSTAEEVDFVISVLPAVVRRAQLAGKDASRL